jgi:ankyrin repeat protein
MTGNELLLKACKNGQIPEIQRLLSPRVLFFTRPPKADVNSTDNAGNTPLSLAVSNRHVDAARLLIANGARVDATLGAEEDSLLHVASDTNDVALVELLIASGATVNAKNKYGLTPLHRAARGSAEIVGLLLAKGAAIDAEAEYFGTPLQEACSDPVRELLIAKGARVDVRDTRFGTILHCAAFCGRLSFAQLLIEKGVSIDAKDDSGREPLHNAARGGSAQIAELLLAKGANIEARDKSNNTPLHCVAEEEHGDVVYRRLFPGIDDDSLGGVMTQQRVLTRFRNAVECDEFEQVHKFSAHYAGLGLMRHRGTDALQGAQGFFDKEKYEHIQKRKREDEGRAAVARVLIARGATLEARAWTGLTPLNRAAANGWAAVVTVLIASGAQVDTEDFAGNTPLHRAAFCGNRKIAELLIAGGANLLSRDCEGRTALDCTRMEGAHDSRSVLRSERETVENLLERIGTEQKVKATAIAQSEPDNVLVEELRALGRRPGFMSSAGSAAFDGDGRNVRAREIGRILNERGGLERMRRAAYEVRGAVGVPASEELSYIWNGIGSWKW